MFYLGPSGNSSATSSFAEQTRTLYSAKPPTAHRAECAHLEDWKLKPAKSNAINCPAVLLTPTQCPRGKSTKLYVCSLTHTQKHAHFLARLQLHLVANPNVTSSPLLSPVHGGTREPFHMLGFLELGDVQRELACPAAPQKSQTALATLPEPSARGNAGSFLLFLNK